MVSKQMYALGSKRSCIRELFEYGLKKAAEIGAENILDFSIGNPSTPAPKEVAEAIVDMMENGDSVALNGYTVAAGDNGARAAIANSLVERFGQKAAAKDVFMTSGAAGALIATIRALVIDHDTEFVAIAPFFPEYSAFVNANGAKLVIVPPDIPDFQVDFDALKAAINKNTQAVIMNSPNNPCGVIYSRETLEKLGATLRACAEEVGHPIYLISDEPYRELVYGNTEVPWVPDFYQDTIICYSYSKSLSLPGQRIGWIFMPENITDHDDVWAAMAGSARVSGHVCASSLYQRVVERCVNVKPDLTTYEINRNLLYDSLTEMGYVCAKPDGAFYLFLQAPDKNAQGFSDQLKEYGVLAVPGNDFGCDSYVRLSYCVPTERIERALPIFKKLI